METVEVVIRIPKEKYDVIMETGNCGLSHNERAIKHGTVLPKGHGDLKDVQDIINRINLNYNNHQSIDAYSLKDMIATVPTIIDADKDGDTDG